MVQNARKKDIYVFIRDGEEVEEIEWVIKLPFLKTCGLCTKGIEHLLKTLNSKLIHYNYVKDRSPPLKIKVINQVGMLCRRTFKKIKISENDIYYNAVDALRERRCI